MKLRRFFSACACPVHLKQPQTVSVVGAPFAFGQPIPGVQNGPSFLRDNGLIEALQALKMWNIVDTGDVDASKEILKIQADKTPEIYPHGNIQRARECGAAVRVVYEKVREEALKGNFVLTLGGDHGLGCGTLAGILSARPGTTIVWVDAHADINTPQLSPSGNFHGMPVAFVMRLLDVLGVPGWEWFPENVRLQADRIVYIALRDVDDGEKVLLKSLGIKAFTMHHVDKYGIGKVMEMALESVNPYNNRPIHCSFDIDACDPSFAPSTGTRVYGGLTFREAHYIVEALAESKNLCSFDMVEVNPNLGSFRDQTVQVAIELCVSALGKSIL